MATLRLTSSTGAQVELEDFELQSPDTTDTHLAQLRATLIATVKAEIECGAVERFADWTLVEESEEPGAVPEA